MAKATKKPRRSKEHPRAADDVARAELARTKRLLRAQQELSRVARQLLRTSELTRATLIGVARNILVADGYVVVDQPQYDALQRRIDELQRKTATIEAPVDERERDRGGILDAVMAGR